jgi:hypothetical protein
VKSLYDFLSNADNGALLGWIGGGLTTVAGGLWLVLKYSLDHQKAKEKRVGWVEPFAKPIKSN